MLYGDNRFDVQIGLTILFSEGLEKSYQPFPSMGVADMLPESAWFSQPVQLAHFDLRITDFEERRRCIDRPGSRWSALGN